jgi:hypothetical protein
MQLDLSKLNFRTGRDCRTGDCVKVALTERDGAAVCDSKSLSTLVFPGSAFRALLTMVNVA